jgi:SpoVK/Ycf46/Vps4 family AAA+-type ATPase
MDRPAPPVFFDAEPQASYARGLGLLKPVLLAPHACIVIVVLWPVQLACSIASAGWIILTGLQPRRVWRCSVWCTRWFTNTLGYLASLTDQYPPFTGRASDYDVQFDVEYREQMSRGAAVAKLLAWILSPTFLFVVLALWVTPWFIGTVAVLFTGRYPRRARRNVMGGVYIYLQFYCMLTHLTDQWDPRTWQWSRPEWDRSPRPKASKGEGSMTTASVTTADQTIGETAFRVQAPGTLRTFADVGGMTPLKEEMRSTLAVMLAYPDLASAYRVRWNGILLHGPAGSGKSLMAEATAGEFALNFLSVGAAELSSPYHGRSAQRIEAAFDEASRHLPCVLFFDEFDAIAMRRSSTAQGEERSTVSQLLRSIERYRALPDLILMAATNDPDRLDEAVVRPGRFDRRVRIDYPDEQNRASILQALINNRPAANIDFASLAASTEGLSAAALAEVVEAAALHAMRARSNGAQGQITSAMLREALAARGGQDRPLVRDWSWDHLVIAPKTKLELIQIERFLTDPDLAGAYGVQAPSGLLLHGPPGTGKTTLARVLAAQAAASFYVVSPADLMSKWVGETEQNISQVFQRARENRPSIVFLDEIDALFPRRGVVGSFDDRWTDQLLQEIDGFKGLPGVFIVGATNRPDLLDPALLRGGRLSRRIEVPLPGIEERVALLHLATADMPLVCADLRAIAAKSEGFSGGDLKALAQDAAIKAATRAEGGAKPQVEQRDLLASLNDFMSERKAS